MAATTPSVASRRRGRAGDRVGARGEPGGVGGERSARARRSVGRRARRARVAVGADARPARSSTRRSTRCGKAIASSAEMKPPIELPTTAAASIPSSSSSCRAGARSRRSRSARGASASGRSRAGRARSRDGRRANTGSCSSQFGQEPDRPCTNTSGGPAPSSIMLTGWPSHDHPALMLAPVDVQPRRAPSGP